MKRVTLKHVVNCCVEDPKFFRALLKNPQKALDLSRLQITAKDMKKLQKLGADKRAMKDFEIYSALVRKYRRFHKDLLW